MFRGILVLCAVVMTAPAFATDLGGIIGTIGDLIGGGHRPGPGPGRPGDGYGNGPACASFDFGWEEHFGGHRDCRDCMARHGRCYEDCNFSEFSCVAQGQKWGRLFEVEERGYDERDTEDRALWACHNRGGNYCRLIGRCNRADRSERRECRDDGGWPGRGRH